MDLPNRQHVARSHAWTLLSNGEPAEEIREAITPALARSIDGALMEVRVELAPATTRDQLAAIIVELGYYMGQKGGGWSVEQRDEWIELHRMDLADMPAKHVLEAVRGARKGCPFPNQFLTWVCEQIDPKIGALRFEEAQLAKLREIARS